MYEVEKKLDFFCPGGVGFKDLVFSLIGKGNAARKQHGGRNLIPGAVFVISHQRITPGGKLYSDLMTSSRVEPNMHKTGFAGGKQPVLQSGLFHTLALPFDYKYLVFLTVLP